MQTKDERDALRTRLTDATALLLDALDALDAKDIEITALRDRLDYERAPSSYYLRAGHDRECACVKFPRALFACDCATARARRELLRELLEANRCISERGSVYSPLPEGVVEVPWLQPGRGLCGRRMRSVAWSGATEEARTCDACGTTYASEAYAHYGALMLPCPEPEAPGSAADSSAAEPGVEG